MQFGDWLDPDAPPDRPWEAKTDSDYLANAFFAQSSRLVAEAATLLGELGMFSTYSTLAAEVASATWTRWADHASSTQTGCAVALEFHIVPESEREKLAGTLAQLVREADGRIATGFLGTPLVLPALSNAGYFDEAYSMLLRHDAPSWLYQVDQGATTVWERWDAIWPDGSIHPGTMAPPPDMAGDEEGHMLSFNHYAYGAVIDWVYRNIAGIAPDRAHPGYRQIVLAPRPAVGIDWARAEIDTPYGRAAISWKLQGSALAAEIDVPFGSSGAFIAPVTSESTIHLNGEAQSGELRLSPGHHTIEVTNPWLANPARKLASS